MIKIPATALLAIASAILLQRLLSRPSHGPVGLCPDLRPDSCPNDPADGGTSVEIGPLSSPGMAGQTIYAEPCRCYSESYFEARDKFRIAAMSVPGAQLTSLEVVPGEPLYTMDIVVVPGSADGLVVHTSGVHGVEGYAGSAIQIAMLRHLSSLTTRSNATNATNNDNAPTPMLQPTLILVHAVNPYGMAHHRRTNEHNVDLNRNALRPEEWAEVLKRDPNLAGYDDFDSMFNPPHKPTAVHAHVLCYLQTIKSILRHGFVNMKRSMVTAQYHNPRGIFYGGRELEPSHKLLLNFLVGGTCNESSSWVSSTSTGTVTWIDVHTGLGPAGIDTLLVHGGKPVGGGAADAHDEWFPNAPRPVQYFFGGGGSGSGGGASSSGGESQSEQQHEREANDVTAGYDLTRGIMNDFYAQLFTSPASRPFVVAQEFGTVPAVMVARAMIIENMAFQFAPDEQPTWSALSRDAFYVRSDEWRRSILDRGLTVLDQAIARSSSPSLSPAAAAEI